MENRKYTNYKKNVFQYLSEIQVNIESHLITSQLISIFQYLMINFIMIKIYFKNIGLVSLAVKINQVIKLIENVIEYKDWIFYFSLAVLIIIILSMILYIRISESKGNSKFKMMRILSFCVFILITICQLLFQPFIYVITEKILVDKQYIYGCFSVSLINFLLSYFMKPSQRILDFLSFLVIPLLLLDQMAGVVALFVACLWLLYTNGSLLLKTLHGLIASVSLWIIVQNQLRDQELNSEQLYLSITFGYIICLICGTLIIRYGQDFQYFSIKDQNINQISQNHLITFNAINTENMEYFNQILIKKKQQDNLFNYINKPADYLNKPADYLNKPLEQITKYDILWLLLKKITEQQLQRELSLKQQMLMIELKLIQNKNLIQIVQLMTKINNDCESKYEKNKYSLMEQYQVYKFIKRMKYIIVFENPNNAVGGRGQSNVYLQGDYININQSITKLEVQTIIQINNKKQQFKHSLQQTLQQITYFWNIFNTNTKPSTTDDLQLPSNLCQSYHLKAISQSLVIQTFSKSIELLQKLTHQLLLIKRQQKNIPTQQNQKKYIQLNIQQQILLVQRISIFFPYFTHTSQFLQLKHQTLQSSYSQTFNYQNNQSLISKKQNKKPIQCNFFIFQYQSFKIVKISDDLSQTLRGQSSVTKSHSYYSQIDDLFPQSLNSYFKQKVERQMTNSIQSQFSIPLIKRYKNSQQILLKTCKIYLIAQFINTIKYLAYFEDLAQNKFQNKSFKSNLKSKSQMKLNVLQSQKYSNLILYNIKTETIESMNVHNILQDNYSACSSQQNLVQYQKFMFQKINSKSIHLNQLLNFKTTDQQFLKNSQQFLNIFKIAFQNNKGIQCFLLCLKNFYNHSHTNGLKQINFQPKKVLLHLIRQFKFDQQHFILLNIQKHNQFNIRHFSKSQQNSNDNNNKNQVQNTNPQEKYKNEQFFCKIQNPYKSKIIQKQADLMIEKFKFNTITIKTIIFIIVIIFGSIQILENKLLLEKELNQLGKFKDSIHKTGNILSNLTNIYNFNFFYYYTTAYPQAIEMMHPIDLEVHMQELILRNTQQLKQTQFHYLKNIQKYQAVPLQYEFHFQNFNSTMSTTGTGFIDLIDNLKNSIVTQNYTFILQNYPAFRQIIQSFTKQNHLNYLYSSESVSSANLTVTLLYIMTFVSYALYFLHQVYCYFKINQTFDLIIQIFNTTHHHHFSSINKKINNLSNLIHSHQYNDCQKFNFKKQKQRKSFVQSASSKFNNQYRLDNTENDLLNQIKNIKDHQSVTISQQNSPFLKNGKSKSFLIISKDKMFQNYKKSKFLLKKPLKNKQKHSLIEKKPIPMQFFQGYIYYLIFLLISFGIITFQMISNQTIKQNNIKVIEYQRQIFQSFLSIKQSSNDAYYFATYLDYFKEPSPIRTKRQKQLLQFNIQTEFQVQLPDSTYPGEFFYEYQQDQKQFLYGDYCQLFDQIDQFFNQTNKILFEEHPFFQCDTIIKGMLTLGYSQGLVGYKYYTNKLENLQLKNFITQQCDQRQGCSDFSQFWYAAAYLEEGITNVVQSFDYYGQIYNKKCENQILINTIVQQLCLIVLGFGFIFWLRKLNKKCKIMIKLFNSIPSTILFDMKITVFMRKNSLLTKLEFL